MLIFQWLDVGFLFIYLFIYFLVTDILFILWSLYSVGMGGNYSRQIRKRIFLKIMSLDVGFLIDKALLVSLSSGYTILSCSCNESGKEGFSKYFS